MELVPRIRREQHPLFNSIVLKPIFGFLSVCNLQNVRLVCKFWDTIASPFLQSKSQVVLIRGRGEMEKRNKTCFKSFLYYIQKLSSEDIFFRNYHIEHWILNEKTDKSLQVFWLKVGPTMKELHLGNIIFYEVKTIRNVLYNWTPSLESLRIEDCLFYTITSENIPPKCEKLLKQEFNETEEEYVFFDYYDRITVQQLKNVVRDPKIPCNFGLKTFQYEQFEEEILPLSWEELFATFPNLKTLKLPSSVPEAVISDILNNASLLQLESLSFSKSSRQGESQLVDSHLVQISHFKPSITHFEIIFGPNVSFQSLQMMLLEHRKSLESLKLYLPPAKPFTKTDDVKIFVTFQFKKLSFSKLTSLALSQEMLRGQPFPSCFQKMTSLVNLKLWDASNEFNWEEPMENIFTNEEATSCANAILLASLQTFSCGYVVKSCAFYEMTFAQCPHLKVLKAPLNDDQIRVVYKHLKIIQEITVYDRYLTDEGLTGNPLLLTQFTEWSGDSQREFAYIGDLKQLCKFTLQYWKYDEITDASVYHGFCDVPNLGYLRLTKTQISDTALQDLVKKSSLLTLITPKVSKGHAH